MSNGLILMPDASSVTLAEIAAVETPAQQAEWTPISHITLLNTVIDELTSNGMVVAESSYGMWQKGARFFGTLVLSGGDDYRTVVGVRNSHDKSFAAGLCMGARVMVCSNLSFSGEVTVARKHTTNILRDLPGLTNRAVARLNDLRGWQDTRIEAYKAWECTDQMAHDFICRAQMIGILPATSVPKILNEWHNPKHEEFAARTAWSLFNCFTEVYKGAPTAVVRRTMTLHGMVDTMAGVEKPSNIIEDADFEIVEEAA